MDNERGVQTNEPSAVWIPVEEKQADHAGSEDGRSENFAYSKSVFIPRFEIRSSGNNTLLATFYDIRIRLFYLRTDEIGGTFGFRILDFTCDSNGWKSRKPLPVGTMYSYDGGQSTEFSEYDSDFMVSCDKRLHFNKLASVPTGNIEFNRVNFFGLTIQSVVWDPC